MTEKAYRILNTLFLTGSQKFSSFLRLSRYLQKKQGSSEKEHFSIPKLSISSKFECTWAYVGPYRKTSFKEDDISATETWKAQAWNENCEDLPVKSPYTSSLWKEHVLSPLFSFLRSRTIGTFEHPEYKPTFTLQNVGALSH